ncbi:M48 family metallopeptidase [Falsirhodobacter xinxiangensis]|uniref:M48 family metallopeptidase n=1 Tax=Falsirhodobacter xinxiangensis TaxID=2530049 RepID=UPI0010AA8375|nr:M48 family metallopeptidase [Rhodobacter xinxiangensis]
MLTLLPLLLAIGYGLVKWQLAAARTKAMLDQRSRPLAEPELEAMTARMAAALNIPHVPVHVIDMDAVNGLAAPDGRIFLTRGFMESFGRNEVTAAELASVIAHELGHVALGHSQRRMIDFTGQNAVLMIVTPVIQRFLPGVGVMLAGLLSQALAARLSRRDEHEADAYASALLVKAGIGTGAQKSMFAKLDRLSGARGTAPAWLLSHPPTPERIRAIEAREERWG